MPVEIREIVIRTHIADSSSPATESTSQAEAIAALKAQIIAECVRQTLSTLKKKDDR